MDSPLKDAPCSPMGSPFTNAGPSRAFHYCHHPHLESRYVLETMLLALVRVGLDDHNSVSGGASSAPRPGAYHPNAPADCRDIPLPGDRRPYRPGTHSRGGLTRPHHTEPTPAVQRAD